MMNRRWFFTAAGGAFLSAACAVMQQPRAERRSALPTEEPLTPDQYFDALVDSFFVGLDDQLGPMLTDPNLSDDQLPRDPAIRKARLAPYLREIYRPRFDHRLKAGGLPGTFKLHKDQACVLGQLTGLAFAYESGALDDPRELSYEKPDPAPILWTKHIDWARDSYGFYIGRTTTKRDHKTAKKKRPFVLCGEPGRPDPLQIDEACPFCFA